MHSSIDENMGQDEEESYVNGTSTNTAIDISKVPKPSQIPIETLRKFADQRLRENNIRLRRLAYCALILTILGIGTGIYNEITITTDKKVSREDDKNNQEEKAKKLKKELARTKEKLAEEEKNKDKVQDILSEVLVKLLVCSSNGESNEKWECLERRMRKPKLQKADHLIRIAFPMKKTHRKKGPRVKYGKK